MSNLRRQKIRGRIMLFVCFILFIFQAHSMDWIKKYEMLPLLSNREYPEKFSLSTPAWKIERCFDCDILIEYTGSGDAWRTSLRHGKLSRPLWSEMKFSSDGKYIFVPYFYSDVLYGERYELIVLDTISRKEYRIGVSEKTAVELDWRKTK